MLLSTLLILFLSSSESAPAVSAQKALETNSVKSEPKKEEKALFDSVKDLACSEMTGEALGVCVCIIQTALTSEDQILRQEIASLKMRLPQAQRRMTPKTQAWVRETSAHCRENLSLKSLRGEAAKKVPTNSPSRSKDPKPTKSNTTEVSPTESRRMGSPKIGPLVPAQETPKSPEVPSVPVPQTNPDQPVPVRVTPVPEQKSQTSKKEPRAKRPEPQNEKEEYEMLNESESDD